MPADDPKPNPLQGPAGVTALYGEVRTVAGKYLPGVKVNLDCSGKVTRGTTDSVGRFLSVNVPAGKCELETDGQGAEDQLNQHGKFDHDVTIVAGRTNQLGYILWMTPIDGRSVVGVAANHAAEQSVVSAAIKG